MRLTTNPTLRLAATYLIIIMVMCIGYSTIFYATSAHQLDRRRPPEMGNFRYGPINGNVDDFLLQRANEGKQALLIQLIGINLVTFVIGALLSYLLAEQTLKPIKENMNAQTRFVSDASHELRTPLTALRTANEVALRQQGLTAAQAKKVLADNVDDVIRLQALTDALLDLLKEDDGRLLQHEVNMQTVVGKAMNLVAPQAMARSIAIDDQMGQHEVHGNEQSLTQVVTILLDNAVKYSPDGSTITVKGLLKSRVLEMRVIDHGIGMDDETIQHIFTRFYRADEARTRKESNGYGLGLSIAKKIIDAHHGKILVKSSPGKGSTFTVRIPVIPVAAATKS